MEKQVIDWKGAYKSRFPEKGWEIKDGLLSVLSSEGKESTNGGDIVTKEKFGAFDLSFEIKLTPGANSGVKYFVTLSENNQVLLLELNTNFWMIHCIQKLKWEERETVPLLLYMI